MRKTVIINADDYGYTAGVSAGIRRASAHGTISSTTAMMNVPGIENAISQAKDETPDLPIGVHLVLTFGTPLSPLARVPSLVGSDGAFHKLGVFAENPALINPDDATREWSAQIERLLEFGSNVDHIDSHHHSSYLHPRLAEAMLKVADRYGVPVRRPPDAPESHPDVIGLFTGNSLNVWMPDIFVGDLMRGSSVPKLEAILQDLPPALVGEVMVHPGYVDEELCATSTYAEPRAAELATLLDPSVPGIIESSHVDLVSFGAARAQMQQ